MHVLHFLWQELSQQDTRRYKRNREQSAFPKSVCHLCTGGGTDKDKPVYIKESVSNTFGYAAWDDGKTGKMGFVMEMPLSVKGDDIKTISYHMENGFFR